MTGHNVEGEEWPQYKNIQFANLRQPTSVDHLDTSQYVNIQYQFGINTIPGVLEQQDKH